ncbi:hypothetical protein ACIPW5_13675 [Streptomyces sp. NPDC090077]|uniref:hypothetical protein n=1 Tax=Streptomyces sp. NPDC090077 TaxID=3365938 RepID=UPI00381D40A9
MTSIDRPEDQGCLRWVLAVPLTLFLYLPAAFFLYGSLVLEPDYPYDPMRDDARVNAVLSVGLWFLGLLLTAVPVFHRTLGRWWYAVPFLLASVAYWRWLTV